LLWLLTLFFRSQGAAGYVQQLQTLLDLYSRSSSAALTNNNVSARLRALLSTLMRLVRNKGARTRLSRLFLLPHALSGHSLTLSLCLYVSVFPPSSDPQLRRNWSNDHIRWAERPAADHASQHGMLASRSNTHTHTRTLVFSLTFLHRQSNASFSFAGNATSFRIPASVVRRVSLVLCCSSHLHHSPSCSSSSARQLHWLVPDHGGWHCLPGDQERDQPLRQQQCHDSHHHRHAGLQQHDHQRVRPFHLHHQHSGSDAQGWHDVVPILE
jgi:hypothetical protein